LLVEVDRLLDLFGCHPTGPLGHTPAFEMGRHRPAVDLEGVGQPVEVCTREVAVDQLIDLGCAQPCLVLLGLALAGEWDER